MPGIGKSRLLLAVSVGRSIAIETFDDEAVQIVASTDEPLYWECDRMLERTSSDGRWRRHRSRFKFATSGRHVAAS